MYFSCICCLWIFSYFTFFFTRSHSRPNPDLRQFEPSHKWHREVNIGHTLSVVFVYSTKSRAVWKHLWHNPFPENGMHDCVSFNRMLRNRSAILHSNNCITIQFSSHTVCATCHVMQWFAMDPLYFRSSFMPSVSACCLSAAQECAACKLCCVSTCSLFNTQTLESHLSNTQKGWRFLHQRKDYTHTHIMSH